MTIAVLFTGNCALIELHLEFNWIPGSFSSHRFTNKNIISYFCVDSNECLWVCTYGFKHFSGLQNSLGITNVNRSHNKPLEPIEQFKSFINKYNYCK